MVFRRWTAFFHSHGHLGATQEQADGPTYLCFPALPQSCQRPFLVSSWSTETVPQDCKNLASDYNTQNLIWVHSPFFYGNCKMETNEYKKYWLGDRKDFRHALQPSDTIIHLCSVEMSQPWGSGVVSCESWHRCSWHFIEAHSHVKKYFYLCEYLQASLDYLDLQLD